MRFGYTVLTLLVALVFLLLIHFVVLGVKTAVVCGSLTYGHEENRYPCTLHPDGE